ncbi:DUF481 domain-containing protein [Lewinella sp. W8]|uniref:DUF481 domain-containing protein n=1 Tax=Lewinella sp. W8 TaxID=2528208 RepID=UPI0010675864|nr:DUF481 domain-containing protein [Lewinella sp. W8]MTB51471.1 DUF481 domain-containing protein [Lewinella sp. W8]
MYVFSPPSRLPVCLTLLFTLIFCTCACAQIVNIEDKRRGYDTTGWYGQLDLGGSLNKNTNLVFTLNGALRLDRHGERGHILLLSDYRLVQVSGRNALNAGFGHLRYGYDLSESWRLEAFGQLQYNEQIRLALRALTGFGVRRRLYERDKSRAYFGILYMFEYDELADQILFYRDHRLSTYLTFRFPIGETIVIANTTYYQPRLPEFNLPRISSVSSLVVRFSKKLSFNTKYTMTQDSRLSRDLPEVPATIYTWTNGLRLTF